MAARIAAKGVAKAPKNASPAVLKTYPSVASMASRSRASWRAKADDIDSGWSAHSRVLPSMSVRRKETVPEGGLGMVLQRAIIDSSGEYLSFRRLPHVRLAW